MAKPKVAFYWCASCGGCEETVVDLNEGLLTVAEAVDIVFWPVAMDFKRKDVEALGDGEIAVSFINGGVRQIYGYSVYAAARYSQKSSQRLLKILHRRAMMLFAP